MKAVQKQSISSEVVRQLKEKISSGGYEVQEKLPSEKDLCLMLNVSRSTIRESFRTLEALGYIEIKAGKGAFVKCKNPETRDSIEDWFNENVLELTEFMDVRSALETLGFKLAIKVINEKDLENLKKIEKEFEIAVKENKINKMVEKDEQFHNEIIRITGNPLIIKMYSFIVNAFRKYREHSFALKENCIHAVVPHNNILKALRLKDEKFGVMSIEEHLRISKEDINNVINK